MQNPKDIPGVCLSLLPSLPDSGALLGGRPSLLCNTTPDRRVPLFFGVFFCFQRYRGRSVEQHISAGQRPEARAWLLRVTLPQSHEAECPSMAPALSILLRKATTCLCVGCRALLPRHWLGGGWEGLTSAGQTGSRQGRQTAEEQVKRGRKLWRSNSNMHLPCPLLKAQKSQIRDSTVSTERSLMRDQTTRFVYNLQCLLLEIKS